MSIPGVEEIAGQLQLGIEQRDRESVLRAAADVRPSVWADVLPRLRRRDVMALVEWLGDDDVATMIQELPPVEAATILADLTEAQAAAVVGRMNPDDAADLLDALPPLEADAILVRMAATDAAELRDLAAYPPDSAGGIMTPAFVAVADDASAAEAIAAIRRLADEAEMVGYVYVVDSEERLVGVLSLRQLVLSPDRTPVVDLLAPSTVSVTVDADQELAARLLTDHNLLAIPVVDDGNRLLGIITEDDVADVLAAEATEDIERLGGSQPLQVPYRLAGVVLLFRKRLGWLLLLFVAEAYTGTVLRNFEDELTAVVALSFFIPLLIGTGGNVGSQTVTLIVRSMAIEEVRLRDIGWIVFKELRVGVLLGVVIAVVAYGRAAILGVEGEIGIVVALTILAVCAWSATIAAALPLLLRQFRIDPAVVSAPLITTLVDGTGLIIYFEFAKVLLRL
jgi:magnesium transporter